MPNIALVLKQEIARVARKALRTENERLVKTVAAQRSDIAELKRRTQALEAQLRQLARAPRGQAAAAASDTAAAEGAKGKRFSAKGMATNRRRLGLSAADFGLLVGTTGQSVYAWESGRTQPRARQVAAIAALRGIGKKQVAARLAELKSQAG